MLESKVFKSTFFLFGRMLVLLIISLYTTRLLLEYLGVVDYGVHSLVWGVTLIFGFLSNSITSSVQRFLNVNDDIKVLGQVYSISLVLFLVIGVVISLALILLKDILFFKYLQIPESRQVVASNIYLFMVASFFVNFISLHFYSCILSKERFSFFSLITIIDSILKFLSVIALAYLDDKLYSYSLLLLLNSFLIVLFLYIYCKINLEFAQFEIVLTLSSYKEMLSFFSWSLFGSFGVVASTQGLPLIANIFYGVVINTSLSIVAQVNSLLSILTGNFQKAFAPYLMRSFVSKENVESKIFLLSKLSFLLYSLIAIPLVFYGEEFLGLWLNIVPEYVYGIVSVSIYIVFFEVLAGPLWMIIQASGDIKRYQLSIFLLMVFSLPVTYMMFSYGFGIYDVWYMLFILNFILFVIRLCFVSVLIGRGFFLSYCKVVVVPVLVFWIVNYGVTFFLKEFYSGGFFELILFNVVDFFVCSVVAVFVLLNEQQRKKFGFVLLRFSNKLFGRG